MLLAHSHLHSVANRIESSIFNNLLFKYDRSRADTEEAEDGVFFPVDKAAFTGLFNELASSPYVLSLVPYLTLLSLVNKTVSVSFLLQNLPA